MLLQKSFCYRLALATVATATFSQAASAALFNLSYTSSAGTITATVEGTIQPDNNTVFVTSVSNPTFNGSPGLAVPFVGTYTSVFGTLTAPGLLSLNGAGLDFIACTIIPSCTDGFGIAPAGLISPGLAFASGPSYGSASDVFVPANYSLTPAATPAVPEPATVLGLLSIAGVGLLSQRQKQEK